MRTVSLPETAMYIKVLNMSQNRSIIFNSIQFKALLSALALSVCVCVCLCGFLLVTHLQIEQNSPNPHGLADFQVVGEQGETWGALVVGRQNLNVHCSDGAPGGEKSPHQPSESTITER